MKQIAEKDWKKLRDMKDEMLGIACELIFLKVEKISENRHGREHEAYIDLFKLIKKEDKKIALMFDEVKRSNAIRILAAWKYHKVISQEKFAEFSDETRQNADYLIG